MKDAKKEYTERSRRDKQDFEARVVQLNAQRRADQQAAEADKEAVIKVRTSPSPAHGRWLFSRVAVFCFWWPRILYYVQRAEEVALQAQKTHNARVEALLSRIEMHEAAESEAMRGKAVAEAAMLEVQAQLSHISAARKVRAVTCCRASSSPALTRVAVGVCAAASLLRPRSKPRSRR